MVCLCLMVSVCLVSVFVCYGLFAFDCLLLVEVIRFALV